MLVYSVLIPVRSSTGRGAGAINHPHVLEHDNRRLDLNNALDDVRHLALPEGSIQRRENAA